jgi:undecaprenyl-diphosphatase
VGQPKLTIAQAASLGLLHGPTELLPISSSGHVTLIPWLRGWDYDQLDPAARKRFEVALHAGVLLGIVVARGGIAGTVAGVGARRLLLLAMATAPGAAAGFVFEQQIERRFGKPGSVAAALLAGSASMVFAERVGSGARRSEEATALDGLALGVAQAVALVPGVSRSGAARAAARLRGFTPAEAERLAFEVGVPLTIGALALKGREALRSDRREWAPLAAGTATAFVSTLATGAVARRVRASSSLLPYAGYRTALAGTVLRRLRQNGAR